MMKRISESLIFFFVCFFNCDLAQKPLTTPGSILDHSSGKHFGTGISLFLVELHRICPILGSTDPQTKLLNYHNDQLNTGITAEKNKPKQTFLISRKEKISLSCGSKNFICMWSTILAITRTTFEWIFEELLLCIRPNESEGMTFGNCAPNLISTRAISEISQTVGISSIISRLMTICYRHISDTFAHLKLKNSIFHINLLILNG